jgi:hypothetical protein
MEHIVRKGNDEMALVLFARVGWMRWYKGPQADDEKPVGGGAYTRDALGHEAYNYLPSTTGEMLGYFQPRWQPAALSATHPSNIALERIKAGFKGDSLSNVLTVFFATDPERGGQYIVGWYPASTVYRYEIPTKLASRQSFGYFVKALAAKAILVPWDQRHFTIPRGSGGAGTANVCYTLEVDETPKGSPWITEALDYINSYSLTNVIQDPAGEPDSAIAGTVTGALEQSAGFQSNPRIRRAIENYAMDWALKYLRQQKYSPRDTHKNKPL